MSSWIIPRASLTNEKIDILKYIKIKTFVIQRIPSSN